MNSSDYPRTSMHGSTLDLLAAVTGAGPSAPTVTSTSTIPAIDNYASSASRTSEGLYVITLREKFPRILHVAPVITRASGVLKHVNVVSWSETAGTITVQVSLADGSGVDDLETSDLLRLWISARKETY